MQDVCGVFIKRLQTLVLSVRHCYFPLAAGAANEQCFGFYGRKFIVVATKASPVSTSANYKYCLCPLRSEPNYTMFVASTISGVYVSSPPKHKIVLKVGLTCSYPKSWYQKKFQTNRTAKELKSYAWHLFNLYLSYRTLDIRVLRVSQLFFCHSNPKSNMQSPNRRIFISYEYGKQFQWHAKIPLQRKHGLSGAHGFIDIIFLYSSTYSHSYSHFYFVSNMCNELICVTETMGHIELKC